MEHIETITTPDVNGLMHVQVPAKWAGRALRIRVEMEDAGAPDTEKTMRKADAIAAMARLAARGGIKGIDDPVAWQRAIRVDRPLPGRE